MTGQDWLEKDFYAVLGVPKDADAAAVKKAYRALARKHHPDANAGDAAAEQRFKDIGEAYSVLSDPEKRQQYDAVRAMRSGARFTAGSGAGPGGAGFEDLFGGMFGGAPRGGYGTRTSGRRSSQGSQEFDDLLADLLGGQAGFGGAPGGGPTGGFPGATRGPVKGADLTATARVTLARALLGAEVDVQVADPGAGPRTVHVRLPAGVKDGQKVRVRGKGATGSAGRGDLLVTVRVESHEVFSWDGAALRVNVPVTFAEAALGATVQVPTLEGVARLKVPAGTPSGRTFRLKGRGPAVKGAPTDLLATVTVVVPQKLSGEARAAVETLRRADEGADPRADLLAAAESLRQEVAS
ncbi:DnaJ C-terminal domain-containing protein [Aquipuribacter nitratireducens]|uniref:DnaJ C-terminal domain-containing protein n=1 Tax=Aquipuribacter nitratireducens TaxID=650104 RepID=A0ABW0GN98_9MICO